jgi:branched-chain amino acid transport system permease protein
VSLLRVCSGHLIGLVFAVLLIGSVPFFGTAYHTVLAFQILMFVALAGSWNLMTGVTGYLSFGHVVFFGVGAYGTAVLITKGGIPWGLAVAGGGVVASMLALVIGAICLRLRGHYFSIATFGLNEVTRVAVLLAAPLTNGAVGISLPVVSSPLPDYYAMLAVVMVTVVATYLIVNSNLGLRFIAVREDEDAARAYGVPTVLLKVSIFVVSAFLGGLVGGIYAHNIAYIEPRTVFLPMLSLQMIVFALFGGKGTVLGPVVGTVVLFVVWEMLWVNFPYVHLVSFGIVTVLIVLYMPNGVVGMLSSLGYRALEMKIPLQVRLSPSRPPRLRATTP